MRFGDAQATPAASRSWLVVVVAVIALFTTILSSTANAGGTKPDGQACKAGNQDRHGHATTVHRSKRGHGGTRHDDDKGATGKRPGHRHNHAKSKGHTKGDTKDTTCKPPATGRIVIEKQAYPDGGGQAFAFTAPGLDADGFTLRDDESVTFDSVTPGVFTVSENATAGWKLHRIYCSGAAKNTTVDAGAVTIKLAAGETVRCVFKNKQVQPPPPTKGRVVITKVTSPAGDPTAFAFVAPSLDADGFTLTDGQSATFTDVAPGTYSVAETAVIGWSLQSLSCTDPTSDTTTDAGTATIKLAAGETVTCTFTNLRAAPPTITTTTPPTPTTVPTVPPAPPAGAVLPETARSPTSRATLTAPSRCVRGSFSVSVNGRPVASVKFYVNGRLRQTVRARKGQTKFRAKFPIGPSRVQRLRAQVSFSGDASPASRTLRATLIRCQAVRGVLPEFTG